MDANRGDKVCACVRKWLFLAHSWFNFIVVKLTRPRFLCFTLFYWSSAWLFRPRFLNFIFFRIIHNRSNHLTKSMCWLLYLTVNTTLHSHGLKQGSSHFYDSVLFDIFIMICGSKSFWKRRKKRPKKQMYQLFAQSFSKTNWKEINHYKNQ